jgi:ubiquinone/menaquinone biosynthesis C-methylase UbiE
MLPTSAQHRTMQPSSMTKTFPVRNMPPKSIPAKTIQARKVGTWGVPVRTIAAAQLTELGSTARKLFAAHAPTFDTENGGWRMNLSKDFTKGSAPTRGAKVLDLGCGTGLITYPIAQAVGPDGLVVGIDVTPEMLEEARRKTALPGSGRVELIEHDLNLNNLTTVEAVREVVQKGGFDLITCCSAFVLLDNPRNSLKHWVELLKPGGKIVIDLPTEDKTLMSLWYKDLRKAVGLVGVFDRSWIKGIHTLEEMYVESGLEVDRSWRTRSYTPEKSYNEKDADRVFEQQIAKNNTLAEKGKLQEAREVWPKLWKSGLRKDGRFWDDYKLYVTVGIKKKTTK